MKILILSRYQDKVYRGAETVVFELSKRLSLRHKVDIFSGESSDSFKKMVKGGYDVVMPMNGRLQSFKAALGRIFGGYKLVIGGHSGIGRDDIFNIAFCRPDVFIALTDYMASWAKRWAWGVKIVKINDGVDTDKFYPKGKKANFGLPGHLVLSVGALEWYKHHEKTIEAVSLLEDCSLVIVGSGRQKQKLEALGKEKLGKKFKIMSSSFEDMPQIYRAGDVFTLPSWDREAFGVVYLEAMASGIPVVAPDDVPRREIVGNGGVLCNVDDPNIFAGSIKKALSLKWGSLPRARAEKFSWDKIAKEYENCLENL